MFTSRWVPAPPRVCHHHHPRPTPSVIPLSLSHSFSHRQLRSQLSLVVIARVLGQQDTLPLWQEKAQVSLRLCPLCPSRPGKPVGSTPCSIQCFSQRLEALGRESRTEFEFFTQILASASSFLCAYCVLGTENREGGIRYFFFLKYI